MRTPTLSLSFAGYVRQPFRKTVESLFYFNPGQARWIEAIRETVEEHGSPVIVEADSRIWIEIEGAGTQCLFACATSGKPVGVVLFSRPEVQFIRILHLAVDETENPVASSERIGIAVALVQEVMKTSRRVRGVQRVQLPYRQNCFLRVAKPDVSGD